VEQASASSLSFQEQADRLRRLVSRFKLEEQAAAPARPAAATARPAAAPAPKRTQPLPRRPMAPQTVGADDEWKEF